MQGGLIDDLSDQDGLVRLLPAQAEPAEPGRPLQPQLALHANTVAGGHDQHGAAPLLPGIGCSGLRALGPTRDVFLSRVGRRPLPTWEAALALLVGLPP